jgi:hypothetical protein
MRFALRAEGLPASDEAKAWPPGLLDKINAMKT